MDKMKANEWAEKYYGLKRNYDSMCRICKEKCTRNEELEGEINIMNQIKEKYDGLVIEHEEYMEQNNKLKKENELLNNSVTDLQKKLNLSETNVNDMKQSLKYKSKVHIELEDAIQKLSMSLSDKEEQQHQNDRKMKEYNTSIRNLQSQILELENKCENFKTNVNNLQSENQNLKTNVIQRDNIILSIENKIKQMSAKFTENVNEYDKLSKEYTTIDKRCKQIKSQCTNYQIDVDILTNRLKHYETSDENKNKTNIKDKIQSLRAIISELETQNKYNIVTIDNLTKAQKESIQLKHQYNELKQSNDEMEETLQSIQAKYDSLQQNYQANNERYKKLEEKFNEINIENNDLKQNKNDLDNELQQLHQQHMRLNNAYNDLQTQYQSYLQNKNHKKLSQLDEIKMLSERQALLKNDFQRVVLENDEWIKKYNNLKSNYDSLNDDYINSKNQSLQFESLLNDTKSLQQKNINQINMINDNKINELNKEIKLLNEKIISLKNDNIVLKNKPTLTISEYTMLCDKEAQLTDIINKMYISDQSSEPSFKCTACNELFVDPVTCQPCGHSFCRKCIKKKKDVCKQCNVKIKYFCNEVLENLTSKFKMRFKTYLPTLLQIAKRKTNVIGVS